MNTPPPDHGIDAPRAVSVLFVLSAAALGLAALLYGLGPFEVLALALALALVAIDLPIVAVAMLWYSRIGKLRQRDRLLDLIAWGWEERVIDIGCGRGLLLIGAAQRLSGPFHK